MKRALNNKEKATLKALKQKGYTPVVKELFGCAGRVSYYGEILELKGLISLSSPGDLSDIPNLAREGIGSTSVQPMQS